MASGVIGNDVPLMGLRVRVPCPPLFGFGRIAERQSNSNAPGPLWFCGHRVACGCS